MPLGVTAITGGRPGCAVGCGSAACRAPGRALAHALAGALARTLRGAPGRGRARFAVLAGSAFVALLAVPHAAPAQESGSASGDSGQTGGNGSNGVGQGGSLTGNGIPSVPPIAGALLPASGADPSSPDLRDNLLNAFGQNTQPVTGAAANTPGWLFDAALLGRETLTDNPNEFGGVNYGQNRHRDDAITEITPSINIIGNGERYQVNLYYAPTGEIYAVDTDESQFRQQGNGHILAIAVPDLAFLDLRGNIQQNPVYGSVGLINTDTLPPSQRETTSSLAATPYLAHTFGGTGTVNAGVGYLYSATEAPSYLNSDNSAVPLALPFDYGSRWLATRRVYGSFTTGEDYGRFQDEIQTDNNFYDGSAALRGAKRILVSDAVSYAINRYVSVLGSFGYENLDYPLSSYSFVGGIWSAGARVTPNGESSITLEYRRIDGITAPYAYGYWQITPRIRVFGSYSQGITTFEQDQQNNLLSGTEDTTGVDASALVAAPLVNSAQQFGANQTLTKAERATVTATYIAGRSVVTLTFNHQRSSLVGNLLDLPPAELAKLGISNAELAAFGLLTTTTSASTASNASWHYDFTGSISGNLLVGYNRNHLAETTTGIYDSVQFSAGLTDAFTDKLTGSVSYLGSRAIDGVGDSYSGQNTDMVLFSLRRAFY